MNRLIFFVTCFIAVNSKSEIISKFNFSILTPVTNLTINNSISLRPVILNTTSVKNDTISNVDLKFERMLEDSFLDKKDQARFCLKNPTECQKNDLIYEDTSNHLVSFLQSKLPPFDLSNVGGVSKKCQRDSQKYMEDLGRFKLWALKMYDSSAKIPSGILNGNINQLGDFDMCLQASSEHDNIFGKYCLASLQVEAPESSYLGVIFNLMQSHNHFNSRLTDPGHRVPRFSSINWALCVPDTCGTKDILSGLKDSVYNIVNNTDLEIRLRVDPELCYSSRPQKWPITSILAWTFFSSFLLFVLYATFYDCNTQSEKNEYIEAFSLAKNYKTLSTIENSPNDIKSLHGIRVFNAIFLMISHKSMAAFFLPYANRTYMVEFVSKLWTVLARACSLYTDPFLMLSGTLTAYSFIGKLQRTNNINIIQEYTFRLFRIVPTFLAIIAFCTFILPTTDSGPMWNLVVTHHSNICKKYWWRNLLFIHNYFGFKDMCLTHTHHIGIDTQLFFLSPILILILWKWPKKGALTLFSIAAYSTLMRYNVTNALQLSNYIHFGTSISQLFKTADNMYTLPAHRITVYIMGIFLGYFLKMYKGLSLSKAQLRTGDALAIGSFIAAFFGPAFMGSINYKYNSTDAAWYAAFAPILWCFSFAWVVFSAHNGHTGVIRNFFSWPGFSLWTKISYTVYLTQFPVFFYNVGKNRSSNFYEFWTTNINIREFAWVILVSIMLTLLVELPFQNIKNILYKKEDPKKVAVALNTAKTK